MAEKNTAAKKTKKIPAIIGIIVIAIGASLFVFQGQIPSDQVQTPSDQVPTPFDQDSEYDFTKTYWQASGPFAIDKPKYLLGENVFMTVNGLMSHEAGNIVFKRPDGIVHRTIPFDGLSKPEFNHYFTPGLSKGLKACGPEDLAGTWQVIFEGVNYAPLTFEIVYDFLEGSKRYYEPIC